MDFISYSTKFGQSAVKNYKPFYEKYHLKSKLSINIFTRRYNVPWVAKASQGVLVIWVFLKGMR